MSRFNWVGELPEKVFGANPFGLISYDREDGSIQDLTKIKVLAQTGITCFECDYDNDLCIVGYENGNLDIIDGSNQVTNQPAFDPSMLSQLIYIGQAKVQISVPPFQIINA